MSLRSAITLDYALDNAALDALYGQSPLKSGESNPTQQDQMEKRLKPALRRIRHGAKALVISFIPLMIARMASVLMPLPSQGFEPTEAAVPWRLLRDANIDVVFATSDGKPAQCDPLALKGVLFGQIGAKPSDAQLYTELLRDSAFQTPIRYDEIQPTDFDALHLAGGHAPGMKPYLESTVLQEKAVEFFSRNLLVSAICHGPVVLARAIDPTTNHSVLLGRRLTALTKLLERSAFWMTAPFLGRHFRTYPEYVQDEICRATGAQGHFETGPLLASYDHGFTVVDDNLMTARWPGDSKALGHALVSALKSR